MQQLIDKRVHEYYWDKDLNCAITTLKVLSEIFNIKINPELLEATYGLNSGRLGLQCGLVQGTLMFIGIYGCKKERRQPEIREICQKYVTSFQDKFGNMQCKELRPQGFSPNNPPHLCESLTKQVIAYSAKFITKNLDDLPHLL